MTGGGFTGEVPLDKVQEAFSKMELENMKIRRSYGFRTFRILEVRGTMVKIVRRIYG